MPEGAEEAVTKERREFATPPRGSPRSTPPTRLTAHWRFWRSPEDQPSWARPTLLTLAALSALAYGWGMNGAALETFYGAAARSMSMSWHNFFFGALDPRATVSVDKLPGALWPQALSLRVFGYHVWAIVLPQVVEGILTVLVIYRAVRRLAGPLAGIAAAAVLASSPVTVALNRGNVADSLLILLSVLAADAVSAALLSGRLRTLLLAGVWVGLAFQTKMGVAWLVLPAFAGAYLLAAPAALRVRLAHVGAAGLVTVIVSLSWISIVSLVPAHDRPYVDGTQNNSLFSQTFQYNGTARLEHSSVLAGAGHPAPFLVHLSEESSAPTHKIAPSWHRLLSGVFGRDDGWLLPAAFLSALAALFLRRGEGRRDPLRVAVLLWGLWLLVLAAFFSAGGYPNSYYVAALSPATAALCGVGAELAWRNRKHARTWQLAAAALLLTVAYGIYLLHGGTSVPGWLAPAAGVLGALGAAVLLIPSRAQPGNQKPRLSPARRALLAMATALLLPTVASLLMVTRGLGPFAAPFEPTSATVSRATASRSRKLDAQIVQQLASAYNTPIPLVTDSSILAAPFILASGREILPIGGYQGGIPSPTLARLQQLISNGEARMFLVPVTSDDPRIQWIHAHCSRYTQPASGEAATSTALYDCNSA